MNLTNARPNEGGGHYVTDDGRFHVQRWSSHKWIIKDTMIDLSNCKKIVGYVGTLNEAPAAITAYLEADKG